MNQVYVRDSAVAVEKFALARRMEHLNEWNKAADVYQEVLSGYSDRVVPRDDSSTAVQYRSVVAVVQERLSRWPVEGIAAYRARFDLEAQTLLDSAGSGPGSGANSGAGARDLTTLNKVFANYFITEAGRTAGVRLVDTELESGEFAAAAWTAQRMLDLQPDLGAQRPMLLYRAAIALHLEGDDKRAHEQLAELEKTAPAALGRVRGRDVALVDSLRELLSNASPLNNSAAMDLESADSWPMTFGNIERSRIAPPASKVGSLLFAPIDLGRPDAGTPGSIASQLQQAAESDRVAGLYTGVYPALDRGELFFQDNARVYALSIDSGLPLPGWAQSYEGERGGKYVAPGCMPMPRGCIASVTLTEDSVLAVMGATDSRMIQFAESMDALHNTRLVRLDRATGRERWSMRPQQLSPAFKEMDLVASPLVVGENIYVQARGGKGLQFEDSYVLCLDYATGKMKWASYIASANIAGSVMQEYGTTSSPSSAYLAYSSGRIFVLTNLGAMAAISAYDGTIAWLDIYPRPEQQVMNRWPIVRQTPPTPPYLFNPVIVADGKVFVLPADGNSLSIYDAGTGEELKRIPTSVSWTDEAKTFRRETITMLAGVVDGEIVATSESLEPAQPSFVLKLDWQKFDPTKVMQSATWTHEVPVSTDDKLAGRARRAPSAQQIAGRPFITRDAVIIPTQSGLYTLSMRNGVIASAPLKWGDDESPGNVLAMGDDLIVAGASKLAVYTDREKVLRRLDDAVMAAQGDPIPRLRYAEVMFVSRELPLAMTKLDEAITLLGGRQSLAPGAARDRLYADLITFARKLTKQSAEENAPMIADLYDRAVDAAQTPQQQVNVRLSRADYARSKRDMAGEMQNLQDILLQPKWRDLLIARGDSSARTAGAIASDGIDDLLARPDGPGTYLPFEKRAAELLEDARAKNNGDALLQIAQAYPNSNSARAALLGAAELFESAGDFRNAVAVLRQVIARRPEAADRVRILESLARNYLAMPNRLDSAAARLSDLARMREQFKITRPMRLPDGQILTDITFAQALEIVQKIQSKLATSALPDLALPVHAASAFNDKPVVVDGIDALCVASPQFARVDRAVAFSSASGLCVFTPGASTPTFTCSAVKEAPRGVAWIGGNLLAWTSDTTYMLDGTSGRLVWQAAPAAMPTPDPASIGDDNADDSPTAAADAPPDDQQVVQLGNGQRVAIKMQMRVVVNGQVVQQRGFRGGNFRLANGRLLAGRGQPQAQQPMQPAIAPPVEPGQGEQITALSPLSDRAIIATNSGRLACVDLIDGAVRWQSRPQRTPVTRLEANDDFVVARYDEAGTARLVAVDAVHGQTAYRRTFSTDPANYLVNFALSDDGTLVWALPDRIAAKDLFTPGDRLRYGEQPMRGVDENSFVTAGGERQFIVSQGRVLAVCDQGKYVRVMSLECGQQIAGSRNASMLLASGADSTGNSVTQLRTAGSMIYVTATAPPKLSAYDLENPGAAWASHSLDRTVLRETMVTRKDFVAVAQAVDDRGRAEGTFSILTHSRERTPAGLESGVLSYSVELTEPAGINACQAVNGGLYYLSGDQKLHFLAAANAK